MSTLLNAATASEGAAASGPAGAGCDYTVQSGDTLWGIAEQFRDGGANWGSLYDQNRDVVGDNPHLIHPDQVLSVCEPQEEAVETPATGLDAYEVVPNDFVGPLAPGQIRESQRDTLDTYDFGSFDVVGDDFVGPMAPGQMGQAEYAEMQQAWLNITSGQGMSMTGSADDQAAMLQIMRDSLSSETARGLITDIGNDTNAAHGITADLGRSQNMTGSANGVIVDTFATNQIDLDDIEAFPSSADAARPNEMTQSDVLLHVLAERRSAALSPADPFQTHHTAAFATQNAYRAEQGQSPILGQNMVPGTTNVNVPFGDGSSQLINFDGSNNHSGSVYTP